MDEKGATYDYQAMVVGSCSSERQLVETDLVLILKSRRERVSLKNRIYGVGKPAFLPPDVESDFDHIESAKNVERRYATPLKFGDVIQFNECDVDHDKRMIIKIKRERPLYEIKSNDNGNLLKLGGVIEPRKPTTFWTPLDSVSIPIEDACRAEPDVWLYAWIKVETNMKGSGDPFHLELTYDSFHGFDPSEQGRVSEAPWHRCSLESRFAMWIAEPTPCDDDDFIDVEPRKDVFVVENKWAEVIHKQLGLFVGDRLLLCKELPQYDFIIPILKPVAAAVNGPQRAFIYPTVGEYFHFGAAWSIHHRAFLVTEMVSVQVLRGHSVTTNGNLVVRVAASGIRGLFKDHDSTLGLIDDPHHHLAFFEFHPAAFENLTAMVEIRAIRASENRSVRYRVVKIIHDDDNVSRYDTWLHDKQFAVGPLYGIVINSDTIICPRYPNIYFRLPVGLQGLPLGTGVRIRGKRHPEIQSEIEIIECLPCPEFSVRKVVQSGDYRLLQVTLKPFPNQVQLAECEHLGIVDNRGLDPPSDSRGGEYMAWVRESPSLRGCRPSCTIMEVWSTALNTPILPISSSKSSSRQSSSKNTPSGSARGSQASSGSRASRTSVTSISTNRFVGPASRRTADQPSNNESPA